ncbi:MAG: hypothetical protein IIC50_06090 [Planctomycetes bacterium]|nr:hypothetical protein [Planctomycetota bacterium]
MKTLRETGGSVTEAIRLLAHTRRRHVVKLATIRGLWLGLCLLLLFFYLDAVVQWGARQRFLAVAVVLGVVLTTWVLTFLLLMRSHSKDRMLARLVEEAHPELNNELINAVDFEEQLSTQETGSASVGLMREGIDQALHAFDDLEEQIACLKPAGLRRESRLLLGVLGVWLCAALFLGTWLWAEAPRFLWPWGDHPPYCATTFIVEPGGTIVDYGKDLEIRVTTQGKRPAEVWLVLREPESGAVNRVGMFSNEPGVYFQTVENIRSALTYHAGVTRGRSRYYQIELSKVPRIEAVDLVYRYPAYAGLRERHQALSLQDGTVKGYRGTEVTMTIRSNRPLEKGRIHVGGQTYAATAHTENSVQAVIPLLATGPFDIVVTDIEGFVSSERFSGKIELLPDGKPYVAIVSPGMQSMATPTSQVPLVIEAQDDLGVRRVRLYCSLNDSDDAARLLLETDEVETFVMLTQTLDLADLGVRPGDVIDYYATVTDSLPSGPQTVASEAFQVQIISEEQLAQMQQTEMTATDLREKYDHILGQLEALIQAQRELQRETRALQEGQEDLDPGARRAVEAQLQALARKQSELAEATRATAAKMLDESEDPAVFDIERDYKKGLAQFAEHMNKAAAHMNEGTRQLESGATCSAAERGDHVQRATQAQAQALAELGDQTQAMRAAIAQANREIERMMALIGDIETFKQLYFAQKHLTRQTKSLRDIEAESFETKIRFKELSEQEAMIGEALVQLQEDLYAHADPIQEDYPEVFADACKIAAEIGTREIPVLMAQGSQFLNQGHGPPGYERVLAAQEQMEAMISFCNGAGGAACESCEFRLRISMSLNPGNTLAQMCRSFGMKFGSGAGFGVGQGAGGVAGGQSNVAVFGGDSFGRNPINNSRVAGGGKRKGEGGSLPDARDALDGNIEALNPQVKHELEIEVNGQDRMMAEYSSLIEAYFRRMAEDQ